MKKNLIMIILSACIAAGFAAGLIACNKKGNNTETTEEAPVSYYGCPNSRRIRKLSLRKKKMN